MSEKLLSRSLTENVKWATRLRSAANDAASMWPAETITRWKADLDQWEQDPDKHDDPFAIPESRMQLCLLLYFLTDICAGFTMKDAERQLAEMEKNEQESPGFVSIHEISAMNLVRRALQLEERQ